MTTPVRNRRAFLYQSEDWVEVPFMSIKKGDIFLLTEADGSIVFSSPWSEYPIVRACSDAKFEVDRGIISSKEPDAYIVSLNAFWHDQEDYLPLNSPGVNNDSN